MDGVRWLKGVLLAAAAIQAAGCGPTSSEPSLDEVADRESYGKLPGLAAVPDQDLRAEYARIVEEGGAPEQLASPPPADEENVAAGLRDLFPPDKIDSILDEANLIVPPPRLGFEYDPVRLQRAVAFWKRYEPQWQEAREALARPKCDFGLQHMRGQAADLTFVNVVWIAARLEFFHAADRLQQDDLDAATRSLENVLRLAACLAGEKHIHPRGQAVFLRSEALWLLEAIVRRPKVQRKHLEGLFNLVQNQLAHWPGDAGAWVGDRAQGMHTYEMVRDGRLMELLQPADIARMGGRDSERDLAGAAQRTVNSDELYYLRVMRRVIDACADPYYRRAALFQDIRTDLQQKHGTGEFPLVAGYVLLPGVAEAQAIQARDRALCEGWALALANAAGLALPPYRANPVTGLPYKVVRNAGRVEVSGVVTGEKGDERPILVPDLTPK